MKIVVTGSLGNISEPLTKELVAQGHAITVISRTPEKQATIAALGATAAIGALEDPDFLASTLAGAEAVYAMVPPDFSAPDSRAHYQAIGRSYVQALQRSGVKRVVHLSSWGADLAEGTGFILGSHDVEGLLGALSGVVITHLRAGSFYTNLFGFAGMIKGMGLMGSNYGGDDKIVWAHPRDIAAAAAEELTRSAAGPNNPAVRYVASDERTATETARILGAAIGKPELTWVTLTDEQTRNGLAQSGIPAHIAALYVELGASIHNGTLRRDYDRHQPHPLGRVKVEDFAQEFAAAF